jgi:hypothetical protein
MTRLKAAPFSTSFSYVPYTVISIYSSATRARLRKFSALIQQRDACLRRSYVIPIRRTMLPPHSISYSPAHLKFVDDFLLTRCSIHAAPAGYTVLSSRRCVPAREMLLRVDHNQISLRDNPRGLVAYQGITSSDFRPLIPHLFMSKYHAHRCVRGM